METLLVTEQEFAKAAEVFRGAQSVRCEPAAADEKSRNAKTPSLDGTEWNPNMKTVYSPEDLPAYEFPTGDHTQGWWFGSAYDGKFPQEHEEGRGMIVGTCTRWTRPVNDSSRTTRCTSSPPTVPSPGRSRPSAVSSRSN